MCARNLGCAVLRRAGQLRSDKMPCTGAIHFGQAADCNRQCFFHFSITVLPCASKATSVVSAVGAFVFRGHLSAHATVLSGIPGAADFVGL